MHTYAEYVKKGKTFLGTKPNERLTVCMAHLFYSRTKQANVFTWRIDLSNRPNNFFHSFVLCAACFFLSLHPFKVIVAYFLVRVVRCWFFILAVNCAHTGMDCPKPLPTANTIATCQIKFQQIYFNYRK